MTYQNYTPYGVNISRLKYGPLDISQVFTSSSDLTYYITYGGTDNGDVSEYWKNITASAALYPYEGQLVSLVTTGSVAVYVLVTDTSEGNNGLNAQGLPIFKLVEITNQKTTITGTAPISVDDNNNITHATGTSMTSTPSITTTDGTKITIPYVTSNTYGHVNGGGSTTVTITLDDGELT